MALLSLSYDTIKENYAALNFRKALIKVLLQNGATDLKSYVASTIHFKTNRQINSWAKILTDNVGDDLRYVISKVAVNTNKKHAFAYKGKRSHRINFVDAVGIVSKTL